MKLLLLALALLFVLALIGAANSRAVRRFFQAQAETEEMFDEIEREEQNARQWWEDERKRRIKALADKTATV